MQISFFLIPKKTLNIKTNEQDFFLIRFHFISFSDYYCTNINFFCWNLEFVELAINFSIAHCVLSADIFFFHRFSRHNQHVHRFLLLHYAHNDLYVIIDTFIFFRVLIHISKLSRFIYIVIQRDNEIDEVIFFKRKKKKNSSKSRFLDYTSAFTILAIFEQKLASFCFA